MALLASAVPERVGLLLLVAPVGPLNVGVLGRVASRVKVMLFDAADRLPAASVDVTEIE